MSNPSTLVYIPPLYYKDMITEDEVDKIIDVAVEEKETNGWLIGVIKRWKEKTKDMNEEAQNVTLAAIMSSVCGNCHMCFQPCWCNSNE